MLELSDELERKFLLHRGNKDCLLVSGSLSFAAFCLVPARLGLFGEGWAAVWAGVTCLEGVEEEILPLCNPNQKYCWFFPRRQTVGILIATACFVTSENQLTIA